MSPASGKLLLVETGLFEVGDEMRAAIGRLEKTGNVPRIDVRSAELAPEDWDRIIDDVLRADTIITV